MNYESFREYLTSRNIHLNTQQEEAMRVVKGPTLLLAVPGSGKTTTMIARIGYMIHCNGINPENILVLTYTNAATNDMRQRYADIFGKEKTVRFQTINSLCNGILREYANRNKQTKPKLLEDNKKLIIDLYRSVYEEYPSEGEISEAQRTISYIKNMMLNVNDIDELRINEHEAKDFYIGYCREMNLRNVIDFDDQLVLSHFILSNQNKLLEDLQNQYPYILVDEAQDTSKIQHEIIRLIARRTQNIFMVGDEDQSIYGFRAAYPQALLEFENKYDHAKVLLLEQNYRSTPQIVNKAKQFIELNKNRKPKEMVTERPSGSDIRFVSFEDRRKQYSFLVDELRHANKSTAVLYRNNESMIPLIYYLQGAKIPYSNRGADTVFFSHKVVRDVRLFFDFAEHPQDRDLFFNLYHRTILKVWKKDAIETINKFDPDKDRTLWHTYRRLFANNKKGLQKLVDKVIAAFDALRTDDAWHAIGRVQYQLREIDDKEKEKFEILRFLTKWEESRNNFLKKLRWLEDIIKEGARDPHGTITLSTIHSSKGLEYDNVYIMDAIDGILPSADAEDLEEERRIFYVAMTRAKDSLTLLRYKNTKMPFVDVISSQRLPKKKSGKPAPGTSVKKTPTAAGAKTTSIFKKGDRIRHSKFGYGKVTGLEGDVVKIQFDSGKKSGFSMKLCNEKGLLKKI